MKKSILLLLFSFLIVSISVNGLGISPDYTYIDFEPFKQGEVVITVMSGESEDRFVSLVIEGDLTEYFEVEKKTQLVKTGEMEQFILYYDFPYKLEKAGPNTLFITLRQSLSENGGIGAALRILSKIIVDVPYPEKYVEYVLSVSNVNEGENLVFNFDVANKGEDNIFGVVPYLDIYDEHNLSNLVKHVDGNKFSLVSGKSESQSISLNSSDIGIGDYFVDAYVVYDLIESMHKNSTFSVGYKDVDVLGYTKEISSGGIKKFLILLKNRWNHDVKEVYLESYLSKDGVPITERSVSHTVDMKALQEVNVPVYLDLTEIRSGDYDLILNIHYSDFVKQEKLRIHVEEIYEVSGGMIVAIIIIILVLLDIGWMVLQSGKGSSRKKDGSENKLSYLQQKLKK